MRLPETQDAIIELASNSELAQGVHTQSRPRAGGTGIALGDVPFDPSRHTVADINPMSLMGEVTGDPYVTLVLPRKDTVINVVTDFGQTGDIQAVSKLKYDLGHDITTEIEDALPSITDRIRRFSIGEIPTVAAHEDYRGLMSHSEDARIEDIQELCLQGLTVIVSDFNKLPLHKQSSNSLEGVAIKVTHPLELPLAPGNGVISLGQGREVNTKKPKELNEWNRRVTEKRQQLFEGLGSTGLQVVEVVYCPTLVDGYNVQKADSELAVAIADYTQAN